MLCPRVCSKLLNKVPAGISSCKRPHVVKVAGGKALRASVASRSTTLAPQPSRCCRSKYPGHVPIKQDQLAVDGKCGEDPGIRDVLFEPSKEAKVATWKVGLLRTHRIFSALVMRWKNCSPARAVPG